jgi:NAD(P)H-hydrate epimerase
VARLAEHPGPIVAVDGPTGLDLSTGEAFGPCRADVTVTFGGVRRGHLLQRERCGKVVIAEMGFPPPDPSWPTLFGDSEARGLVPPFSAAMHKGERGRVVVIGGAEGMAGAALHAASAAFAAGAGVVKIAASPTTVQAAQTALPDALTVTTALAAPLEAELEDAIDWADALVVGPGLGRAPERVAFVRAVLERTHTPVVLDADALHVGLDTVEVGDAARVLTPHPGEFQATFRESAGLAGADRFAAVEHALHGVAASTAVLLKGVPTVIGQRGHALRVVATGNPALATGGSGDLLAGFIAAFLARGVEPFDAAGLGAFTLGRGAELAAAELSVRATRPADVLAAVPELWRRLAESHTYLPPVLVELPPPALV